MNIFEKMTQLQEDFNITLAEFKTAHNDAKDLINSIRERYDREKERRAIRMAELEKIVNDASRSATVKRVAADELSKLRKATFAATPEEKAAFAELADQADRALGDAKEIQRTVQSVRNEAKQEIEKISKNVCGNGTVSAADTWMPGNRVEFSRLCREVSFDD